MSGFEDWKCIGVFAALEEPELEQVRAAFSHRMVPAGENLVTEGEDGDEMFVLVRGKVRITKSMLLSNVNIPFLTMENPCKVLATLDGSSYPIFGEMALVDRDVRSATIQVLEDSDFLVTDRERFFELARLNPGLGFKLLLAVSRRLAATVRRNNQELVKLTTALALALERSVR